MLPWVDPEPDRSAIADYLVYGYVPTPATAFASIHKVRPGERIVLEEGAIRMERYWQLGLPLTSSRTNGGDATEWVRGRLAEP